MDKYTFDVITTDQQKVKISCNQNMMDFKKKIAEKELDVPFDHLIMVDNNNRVYSQSNPPKIYQNVKQFRVFTVPSLFQSVQNQKQEIEQLNIQVKNGNEEINKLKHKIKEQEALSKLQIEEMKNIIESQKNQSNDSNDQMQNEITKLKIEISQNKTQLENDKKQLQDQVNQKEEQIKTLTAKNTTLNQDINRITSEKEDFQKQLTTAKEEAKEVAQQYETYIHQLQSQLAEYSNSYQTVYQQCIGYYKQCYEKEAQIQELIQTNNQLEKDLEKIRSDHREEKSNLKKQHEKEIDVTENKVLELQVKLDQMTQQHQKEKTKNAELTQKLQNQQQQQY